MKILHVINSLRTGGAERLVVEMLPVMSNAGHDVRLLLLQENAAAPFERQVRSSGMHVDVVTAVGGLYSPLYVGKLVPYMRGYDVVHVHLFPSQYWAALAHSLSGRKSVLVTTEHNTFNTRARFLLTTWADRLVYGCYDGIVCISQATRDFMHGRVPENVALKVVENGIRLPSVADAVWCLSRKGIVDGVGDDDFMVLQVARFSEQKNQDCLIRALKTLPDNVHAVFAGDGVRLNICKKLADDIGVASRAHFLGQRTDIDDLWTAADIGVMSSHWEGFGLAALEGMARKRPVVGSRVEGLSEVINDDDLLFSPDNDGELAGKISSLMNDEGLYRRKADACYARSQMYSIEKTAADYLAFYAQLLKAKRDGRK